MTKHKEGKLRSKFTWWPPSWIWTFQVSGPPQLLCVSLTIVYTCQDHVLESLKMASVVVILDSKYSKITPKFVKQKWQWLHSSIKFANPVNVRPSAAKIRFALCSQMSKLSKDTSRRKRENSACHDLCCHELMSHVRLVCQHSISKPSWKRSKNILPLKQQFFCFSFASGTFGSKWRASQTE